MSTIKVIQSSDLITNSRADINDNFSALNTDKIETSVLDTDTTLAANSDAKVPTQKAVKAYVDAGGNVNATETTKGIVEVATAAEVAAGTDVGSTGASLVVVPSEMNTQIDAKIAAAGAYVNGVTTRDMSAASGTQTIAHGLSTTPVSVSLEARYSSSSVYIETSSGAFDASGNSCVFTAVKTASTEATLLGSSATYAIVVQNGTSGTSHQKGIVTVDGTNITITWTKTGTPTGTASILWKAN
jgi:hypothetical protein